MHGQTLVAVCGLRRAFRKEFLPTRPPRWNDRGEHLLLALRHWQSRTQRGSILLYSCGCNVRWKKQRISSFLCGAHASARQHLPSFAAVLCSSVGCLRRTWSSRARGWTHCSPYLLWCPVGELVRTPDRKTHLCRNPDFVIVARPCGRACSSDVAVFHTASDRVSSYPVVGLRCPTVLGDAWVVSPAQ